MKLAPPRDDRTLPSGFRASTRPVQIQRATRGKALRINFGASIHRVVGLDIADPVFYPDSSALRDQWEPRIDLLLDELRTDAASRAERQVGLERALREIDAVLNRTRGLLR